MARRARETAAVAAVVSGPAPLLPQPAAIRLMAHHGFIDQDGVHQLWTPGQVVSDPDTVALLISRGARHEME